MKKPSLCILVFLFIFAVLSGCSSDSPPEINAYIDCSFTASFGELMLEGIVINSLDGEMYLDLSTPDELYGLNYTWDDSLAIGYRGLNALTESDYLADTGFAAAVRNVLTSIYNTSFDGKDEGMYLFSGICKSGSFTITTDKSGNIKTIALPSLDMKLEFI